MPDDDLNERARDIGAAVKAADDKRRADAEAAGAGMAKILAALESIGSRMDRLEAAATTASAESDEPRADAAAPMTDDECRSGLAAAQARADAVANHFGLRAPPPLVGETPDRYRKRVLVDMKKHSPDYQKLDVTQLSGELLNIAEKRIFADAVAASACPIAPDGDLVERRVRDQAGRERIEFYGRPSAWIGAFGMPPLRVKITRPRSEW